jgi:hypothetical protein
MTKLIYWTPFQLNSNICLKYKYIYRNDLYRTEATTILLVPPIVWPNILKLLSVQRLTETSNMD